MFHKFTVIFAVLAVTLLATSAYGHPTVEEATASENGGKVVETTSAKHGLRGWLMNVGKRHHEHVKDCKHGENGGVLAWVKNKFKPAKTSTATSPTITDEPNEYGYQTPEPVIDNNNSGVVPEPFDGNGEVPSENNERPAEAGSEVEYATDESAENVPYAITESPSEFADPSIDLRTTFV